MKRKLIKTKKRGFSLVEIIVAIAISVVTITSSVTFTAQLMKRAQTNYMELSALQLHNVVIEQLRLLESALKKDVKIYSYTDSGSYIYNSASGIPMQPWAQLCAKDSTIYFFSVENDENNGVLIFENIASPAKTVTIEGNSFNFYRYSDAVKSNFGGFTNVETEVLVSVRKEYKTDASIGDYISLKSVIGYKLYGEYYFTNPVETKMLWSLVCK